MKCERIRELLLTDHADGELGGLERRAVDEHVRLCASCRGLREAVASSASAIRAGAAPEEAPSYIWERVKAGIAPEPAARGGVLRRAVRGIGEAFAVLARLPKPALAFAAAAMIIVAVFATRPAGDAGVNAYLAEQADFMARLEAADIDGNGFFDADIRAGGENILGNAV